ncbi:MAG: rhomboid family intramembrane serine protease [Proteobacteria bacterium]|nr:rhomboid family intramembrane serine protease [Pseudomonadota bacterium]MDA1300941.1 rhomboid family intramembrane serine protease [Pseudomonadota bacterium]
MKQLFANWIVGGRAVIVLVVLVWCVEGVNSLLGHRLNYYGVYPRNLETLPGIIFWVFLHGNFEHLLVNTTPLLVMGLLVGTRGTSRFIFVSVMVTLLAGLLVWCFGRVAFHIGASGLVFGYFGYLVALGVYERSPSTLIVSGFMVIYYGGLIYGVLPGDSFVSWEGHLFGLLAGILAARLSANRAGKRDEPFF